MIVQRYEFGSDGVCYRSSNGDYVLYSDYKFQKEEFIETLERGRDATGFSDDYFRGMYNGIEWALSCFDGRMPSFQHFNSGAEKHEIVTSSEEESDE